MELNRLEIPKLITPEHIPVLQAETRKLDNGLGVYVINAGSEDVVRLEIIFPSGTTGKADFTTAAGAHQLLDSGTSTKKAIDIAEGFDYYGSYLQNDFGPDWKTVSLFSLSRFFEETLNRLLEILDDVSYTEEEIATWKTRSIQLLKVNNEKVSWLSKVAFNETLYGNFHPYG